jgi:hypothetical protein
MVEQMIFPTTELPAIFEQTQNASKLLTQRLNASTLFIHNSPHFSTHVNISPIYIIYTVYTDIYTLRSLQRG